MLSISNWKKENICLKNNPVTRFERDLNSFYCLIGNSRWNSTQSRDFKTNLNLKLYFPSFEHTILWLLTVLGHGKNEWSWFSSKTPYFADSDETEASKFSSPEPWMAYIGRISIVQNLTAACDNDFFSSCVICFSLDMNFSIDGLLAKALHFKWWFVILFVPFRVSYSSSRPHRHWIKFVSSAKMVHDLRVQQWKTFYRSTFVDNVL